MKESEILAPNPFFSPTTTLIDWEEKSASFL